VSVAGHRIIVTGASSGLGASAVRHLVGLGAHVLGAARRLDRLEHLAADLAGAPGRIVVHRADVTVDADARAMAAAAVEAFGGIDVVVNNAGSEVQAPIDVLAESDLEGMLRANVMSVFLCTRAALAELRRSRGAVINLGSTVVARPPRGRFGYVASKGAVEAMSRALALDLGRDGIRVNVIIDWAGSIKMDQAMLDQLTEAGVKLERYRPLRWYNLGRMNNRTHRKLLVVDGRVGFTGGVGIADQWLGTAQDPEHWRDMHFRIEGPVVAQFQAAFNDNWVRTTGEVLNGAEYFPQLKPLGDLDAHLFISSQAGGSDSMHLMYLMSIAAAARTLDLAASYFVPDALINKALVAARHREVRVRILLPGEHMDLATVQLASRENWGELLKAGVEIYQYRPTMLHTKLLIVDREMVSVGSTNFDIRSFRLNDEASLNVYDRAFAERMTAVFERDLRQASAYSYQAWSGRPWTERFLEKFVLPLKSQL